MMFNLTILTLSIEFGLTDETNCVINKEILVNKTYTEGINPMIRA